MQCLSLRCSQEKLASRRKDSDKLVKDLLGVLYVLKDLRVYDRVVGSVRFRYFVQAADEIMRGPPVLVVGLDEVGGLVLCVGEIFL